MVKSGDVKDSDPVSGVMKTLRGAFGDDILRC